MTALSAFESQITEAVEKLSESVVSIDSVRVAREFGHGFIPVEGKGSGVIIDPKGYVITNNHVIDGAARVQVHLKDGRSFIGEVVGADPCAPVHEHEAGAMDDQPLRPMRGQGGVWREKSK